MPQKVRHALGHFYFELPEIKTSLFYFFEVGLLLMGKGQIVKYLLINQSFQYL